MTEPKPPQPARDLGSLDFELTDIGEARLALDEMPAGISSRVRLDPSFWSQRRRASQISDRALTGETVKWLMQLPSAVRPQQLSLQFPRLSNFLASVWPSPPEAAAALEALLVDRRGDRRGLPNAIQQEVRVMLTHVSQQYAARRDRTTHAGELQRARELLEAAGYRVIAPPG